MKVLFVNENIGGHVTTHLHLRRELAGHGDIDALFLDVPRPTLPRKLVGAPVPGLARLDLDLQPLRSQLALSAWTQRHLPLHLNGVDVLHVFTQNAALLSSRILAARPSVIATDSTGALNAYRLPYRRPTRFTPWSVAVAAAFERRVLAAADLALATSDAAAESMREHYGVPTSKIRRVQYGVSAPAFDTPAAPGTGASRPRLVFVGRQLARKGGSQLLGVHQDRLRDRCELVLVTTERVAPAPGVQVVNDLRPGDPRLWELLRDAAVFVFPSRIDQQPNAVMEAMAAGLPVIAHPEQAIGDMVVDGVTGLHLPDTTDAALVAAIEVLLADPARRATMGAAGRARFDARFSARVTTAHVIAALHEAVERHRERARA